ncbi:DUF2017 family protein [Cellulosimicrobium sp. CUA-896]|uniref:DUF2017 family protein n=1 Tax=Cellulosimicrobium sp. CUA-896 TaxID=1517881 RepID=UPI000968D5F8|nr:DUF2017 family protein [Cellulosimicrobium sp. CUA-896]OLT54371.1 hypothetical protein BJF88_09290 [Cellulosimicrobium sp. CUA-896]
MRPFRPEPLGYVAELEPSERIVLAQVAGDVAQMLQDEVGDRAVAPADPPEPRGGVDGAWTPPGWTGPPPTPGDAAEGAPADPAVRRLLPDASDDTDVAAEFRRFTQGDLAAEKIGRLVLLGQMLVDGEPASAAPFVVPRDTARRVAGALTDVRLVLAERLDLRTDAQVEGLYDELDSEGEDGPQGDVDGGAARRFLVSVFLLTGLLQESLVDGMLADLRAGHGDTRA